MLQRAFRRTFASRPNVASPAILSDAIAKLAINDDPDVRASFVSAFAPLVHGKKVRVGNVYALPEVTTAFLGRDMRHGIALRYRVREGAGSDNSEEASEPEQAETGRELMKVVPQSYDRALVEIQQRYEGYLPARTLAHASGHFMVTINDTLRLVKLENKTAAKAAAASKTAQTAAKAAAAEAAAAKAATAAEVAAAEVAAAKAEKEAELAAADAAMFAEAAAKAAAKEAVKNSPAASSSRVRSTGPRGTYTNDLYTAYVRVEPVHLIMLNGFCEAYDCNGTGTWRAAGSNPMLPSDRSSYRYTWAAPLFSTFRLTSAAPNLCVEEGAPDPGLTAFARSLYNRLSITIVNLPLVPPASSLHKVDDWLRHATLPEHKEALQSDALRQWLVYLAQATVDGDKVCLPAELSELDTFRKSASSVERRLLVAGPPQLSPKEVEELAFSLETEVAARLEAEGKVQALQQEIERLRAGRPSGSV